MKLFSISILSAVLLPLASADDLAMGIIINGGYHADSDHCNDADREVLGGAFNEVMEKVSTESATRRDLSQRRELTFNCNHYCVGFPPGYCYMAYPMCGNHRRAERNLMISELVMEKLEGNMAKAGLRKVPDGFTGFQTRLMKKCKKAKYDIKERLKGLSVSPGCQKLMHLQFDFVCLRVPTEQ